MAMLAWNINILAPVFNLVADIIFNFVGFGSIL